MLKAAAWEPQPRLFDKRCSVSSAGRRIRPPQPSRWSQQSSTPFKLVNEVVGCGEQTSSQFLQLKAAHSELLKGLKVVLLDNGENVQGEPAGGAREKARQAPTNVTAARALNVERHLLVFLSPWRSATKPQAPNLTLDFTVPSSQKRLTKTMQNNKNMLMCVPYVGCFGIWFNECFTMSHTIRGQVCVCLPPVKM